MRLTRRPPAERNRKPVARRSAEPRWIVVERGAVGAREALLSRRWVRTAALDGRDSAAEVLRDPEHAEPFGAQCLNCGSRGGGHARGFAV